MTRIYQAKSLIAHQARLHWAHLCADKTICTSGAKELLVAAPHRVSLDLETEREERVPAYVEVFVDDKRVTEGEVGKARTFDLGTPSAGPHPIDVHVINPFTPQARERRLRIRSDVH